MATQVQQRYWTPVVSRGLGTFSNQALFFLVIVVWHSCTIADSAERNTNESTDKNGAPNILLIMADDLGYSDLGCYGGEIETPNLDQLAADGVRFSHFRGTPMCVTSRVALLAGMPFHRAGALNYSHSAPLPQLLKRAGYRTLMTGKWHAGSPDPRSPNLFDRSFGFLSGMTDSFVGADDWFLDDQPFHDFPAGFYSTAAFVDKSIQFMQESVEKKQPFLMFVAFNAPHHPCQAPQATVEKYVDRYQSGYDSVRRDRYHRQLKMKLVDPAWELAPMGNDTRTWDELTNHRKQVEAVRMAAYAAAVDEVDQGVGRLLKFLQDARIDQNTYVFFLSDNGGDYNNGSLATDEKQIAWLPGSNPTSSNGWAAVKCTPFHYYKHSCHEGGLAVPLIVKAAGGVPAISLQAAPLSDKSKAPTTADGESNHVACLPGTIVCNAASITDLYPTILELAGIEYPAHFQNRKLASLTGSSLLPLLLQDQDRPGNPDFNWYEDVSRSWIEDDWKVVSLYGGPWQLFSLAEDRGETRDLANLHSEHTANLVDKWTAFAVKSGVPQATRVPLDDQLRWGWHRLKMACPSLQSLEPANGSTTDSVSLKIRLQFNQPIDFRDSENKSIRLFSVSDESTPIWQADPDQQHLSQGKRFITFEDIPTLNADQQYYFLWDAGWVKVGNKPIGILNDGAYWWRFRTPAKIPATRKSNPPAKENGPPGEP